MEPCAILSQRVPAAIYAANAFKKGLRIVALIIFCPRSAYVVCKRWSTLVWSSQRHFEIRHPTSYSPITFKNLSLLTNLEKLRVVSTKSSFAFAHIPSFSKLKYLKVSHLPLQVAASFHAAAFGLDPEPSRMGLLRNLVDLILCQESFSTGSRAPLAKAIVRTCPRLGTLHLRAATPPVSTLRPEDLLEYEEVFSVVSTLRSIETLGVDIALPFFNWGALRAAPKFRRILFSRATGENLLNFQLQLVEHMCEKNLAFAECFLAGEPFSPSSQALLLRLLDMYEKENVTPSTLYYRELCRRALGTDASVMGDAVFKHPLMLKALDAFPDIGEGCLNVLKKIEHPSSAFFKHVLFLERRFQTVLRTNGRQGSMNFVNQAFSSFVGGKALVLHDALLAEFPDAISEQELFFEYVGAGVTWRPHLESIVSRVLSLAPAERDVRLSMLFDLSGDPQELRIMQALLRYGSVDSLRVRNFWVARPRFVAEFHFAEFQDPLPALCKARTVSVRVPLVCASLRYLVHRRGE